MRNVSIYGQQRPSAVTHPATHLPVLRIVDGSTCSGIRRQPLRTQIGIVGIFDVADDLCLDILLVNRVDLGLDGGGNVFCGIFHGLWCCKSASTPAQA